MTPGINSNGPFILVREQIRHSGTGALKLLAVLLDNKLSYNEHIIQVYCKASRELNVLIRIGSFFEEATRLLIYKCFIKSHFEYCSFVLSLSLRVICMVPLSYRKL